MRLFNLACALLTVVIVTGACSASETATPQKPAAKPSPSTSTTPATPPASMTESPGSSSTSSVKNPKLMFQDGFSDSTSGWVVVQSDANKGGKYENGAYSIWINNQGFPVLLNTRFKPLNDFILEVDVTKQPGSKGTYWGVAYRADAKSNMFFSYSDNGTCAFAKWVDGKNTLLSDLTTCKDLKPDGEANHLKIVCSGTQHEAYINGNRVATATSDMNMTINGLITFSCAASTSAGAKYTIDNFKLYSLE
jgi:hypothetical protein